MAIRIGPIIAEHWVLHCVSGHDCFRLIGLPDLSVFQTLVVPVHSEIAFVKEAAIHFSVLEYSLAWDESSANRAEHTLDRQLLIKALLFLWVMLSVVADLNVLVSVDKALEKRKLIFFELIFVVSVSHP